LTLFYFFPPVEAFSFFYGKFFWRVLPPHLSGALESFPLAGPVHRDFLSRLPQAMFFPALCKASFPSRADSGGKVSFFWRIRSFWVSFFSGFGLLHPAPNFPSKIGGDFDSLSLRSLARKGREFPPRWSSFPLCVYAVFFPPLAERIGPPLVHVDFPRPFLSLQEKEFPSNFYDLLLFEIACRCFLSSFLV